MLRGAVQLRSNDKYDGDWRRWVRFREQCPGGHDESGWYLDQYTLVDKVRIVGAYMLHAYTELNLSANTIIGSLSGIKHQFRSTYRDCALFGHESIKGSKTALALDERMQAETCVQTKKLPMSIDMVVELVERLSSGTINQHMASVAVQLAFFYLLRQSEYIYNPESVKKKCDHALRAEDVTFEVRTDRGLIWYESWEVKAYMWEHVTLVKYNLRSAKNDADRTGNVFWSRNQREVGGINIVKVAFDWAVRARLSRGCYFMSCRYANTQRYIVLRYDDVSKAIKQCAERFGFTAAEFGTHSPRIGGACSLRAGDMSNETIMSMGRWKSISAALGYQGASFREYDAVQSILKSSTQFNVDDIKLIHRKLTSLSKPRQAEYSGRSVRFV